MKRQLRDAREVDISEHVPPTARSVKLTVTVDPPSGTVLVYSRRPLDPVRFDGPRQTKDVLIDGPTIYVQLVQGARDYQIHCAGWADKPS